MGFKDILVLVDNAPECEARMRTAMGLAERFGAHLTALYPVIEPSWPAYAYGPLPASVIDDMTARVRKLRDDVQAATEKQAKGFSGSFEFRADESWDSEAAHRIAIHARHADLIVLGQSHPDRPPVAGIDLPERVLLQAGRPGLVVPYIGDGSVPGKNVLVAWDGGREAARAVNDALPLLVAAGQVTVLTVDAEDRPEQHGDIAGADIALHLARHGVKTEVKRTSSEGIGVAETLLSRIADLGADLVVMGAYGHSRTRELILGGASRGVLGQMTVPAFMSH